MEAIEKIFNKVHPTALDNNFIQSIGYDWMLITAGNKTDYNLMTAAWGGIGFLWQMPVCYIFVRPQRYTYQFTEKYDHFTLSFFPKGYKKMLSWCGSFSGRDFDKVNKWDLHIVETPAKSIAFQEASLVIECKKLYAGWIEEDKFIDTGIIDQIYPKKDFHKLYIGEILGCFKK